MPASGLATGRSFTQLSMLKRKLEENDNISVFRLNFAPPAMFELAAL
jgi:hypothetical protein